MIGARIRARREQLGLSQTQLGEGLDISFQQVQKYEKGANRVSASRIAALSKILDVPNTYFFSGAITPEARISDESLQLMTDASRDGRRLLRAFERIPGADHRIRVIAIVEMIAMALGHGAPDASDLDARGPDAKDPDAKDPDTNA